MAMANDQHPLSPSPSPASGDWAGLAVTSPPTPNPSPASGGGVRGSAGEGLFRFFHNESE